ncbi:MAG: alginate lyase family protein [Victivallales bacterium]|nr:alginate lyase family protein [Victivallales bacterium]
MSTPHFQPALTGDILRECNFFELYPFDGGGCFIHRKYIGTLDDMAAAENILNGALDDFGGLNQLDFGRYERWSTIEQSCWLNRMYFLVPLAKYAALKQDGAVAELCYRIVEEFDTRHPAPADREAAEAHYRRVVHERDNGYNAHGPEYDAPVEYIWFDFQVASRIIHLIHALRFLDKSPALTPERRKRFAEMLRQHARCIYYVEKFCTAPELNNHQTVRALALLYACELFRDEEESRQWLPTAMELCRYHILNDFLEDGMGYDLSPSYHAFECWIVRDMLIIARRNGWNLGEDARKRADAALALCRILKQPDNLSPVINDGYALEMTPFLRSMPQLPGPEKLRLSRSGIAVRSRGGDYLLFDCSPLLRKTCHYHAGKMGLTLFMGGRPFLVDGGCCSYDDPEFSLHYKRSAAHSSLTVDGNDDALLSGRYTWPAAPEITLCDWVEDTISAALTSNAPGWDGVEWRRTVTAGETSVVICDEVNSRREIAMTFQLMLHSDVQVKQDGDGMILKNHDVVLRLTSTLPAVISDALGFRDFRQQPQLRLLFSSGAAGGTFGITLERIA